MIVKQVYYMYNQTVSEQLIKQHLYNKDQNGFIKNVVYVHICKEGHHGVDSIWGGPLSQYSARFSISETNINWTS